VTQFDPQKILKVDAEIRFGTGKVTVFPPRRAAFGFVQGRFEVLWFGDQRKTGTRNSTGSVSLAPAAIDPYRAHIERT